jgi:hypothetical protein
VTGPAPVICFTLARPLPLLNRMLRTSHWTRSKERRALAWEIATKVPYWSRPQKPFRKAKVIVTRRSLREADEDNILVKHLLDVLQPMHPDRCPDGLGIILDDSKACLTLERRAERVARRSEQCTLVVIEGEA